MPASVLINRKHEILHFAGPTQDYLAQPTGVPTQDLISRARDGLQARLRGAIRKAIDDERAHGRDRRPRPRGMTAWHRVEVTAEPLEGSREIEGLLLVSFADEPRARDAGAGAPGSPREHDEPLVRQLEDELRTTREDLQSTLEDLQSSNQELRVANEEVMSVNEELRSTNEELETSKEELQSLNEELNTVNAELKEQGRRAGAGEQRPRQPADQHQHRDGLPRHELPRATVHAGRDPALRPDPCGRRAADRRRGPAVHRPRSPAATPRPCSPTLSPISKEVQDRDGRWFVRQVLPYRTHDNRIEGVVITFSDVAAEALHEARLYAEAIVDTVREPLLVLDADLAVQSANRSFYQTFQVSPEATVGRPVHELGDTPAGRSAAAGAARRRAPPSGER